MTSLMPDTGALQVIFVVLCWWQVEGGSWPFAVALWFASMSALISALGGFAIGLADMDDMAMPWVWDPDPPLTRAQVPAPAAIRTRAARAPIQRGWRDPRRGPGRPGRG